MNSPNDKTPLEVSDDTLDAAYRHWYTADQVDEEAREDLRRMLNRVAPLIVADELDRLVADTDWAWAVGGNLTCRAAELRATI